jgi:hypothetical protein
MLRPRSGVPRLVNIVRRAGTYHFRRVVPDALRRRLSRRELVRSLCTVKATAAKLRADLLYRHSEHLFTAAAFPMLSENELARLVQDFYKLVFTLDDHYRVLDGPLTDDERLARVGTSMK